MCYAFQGLNEERGPPRPPLDPSADVAELVDALVSGSRASTDHPCKHLGKTLGKPFWGLDYTSVLTQSPKLIHTDTQIMAVDLATWKPGDWLRLADGALVRPTTLRRGVGVTVDRYYLCDGDISYSQDGSYCGSSSSMATIVKIIPSEEMTLLEWIKDRKPTKNDGYGQFDQVQVRRSSGRVESTNYTHICSGNPWAYCPGWEPPAPSPLTPEQEIEALKARVSELERQLAE